MGQTRPLFVYFHCFSHDKYSRNTLNDKSIAGVVGTQTRGGRVVGADESTELWQHPVLKMLPHTIFFLIDGCNFLRV